jgi:hypothetical protein
MHIGMLSLGLVAFQAEASMTAGIVRHWSEELPVKRHWFEPIGDGRYDSC